MRLLNPLIVHGLALMCVVGFTAGCKASASNQAQEDARSSVVLDEPLGFLIEPQPAAKMGYRLGWSSPIKLLDGQSITSVTVLDDMILVIEDPINMVTALKADSGDLLWKTVLGSELESLFAPSRDGKELFLHSASRLFTVEARTGTVTAVGALEKPVSAPGVYSEMHRLMVMSGVDGRVFAHSVDNNFSRWSYQLSNRVSSSPVLAGQDVFVVDTGGTYAMLEASSGLPLWRNHTLGPVTTSPAIQDSEVIVASADGKLYAINRTTGQDTWTYLGAEQPLNASPTVLGRLIVQPLRPNNGLVAIDAISGEELWRSDRNATPVLSREQDMVMHTGETLVSIDLDTGELLEEVPTLPLMSVKQVGEDRGLLLVSAKGRLLKLSPIE